MGQVLSTGLGIKASKRNPTKWKRWHVLESLCKKFKWTKGIELGVKDGKTFLHLLKFCHVSMVGIDVWEAIDTQDRDFDHKRNYDYVKIMTLEFPNKKYKLIKGRTDEVHNQLDNKAYDFVFIDADHSEGAVRKDIELYEPKVTTAVIGHDIHFESVRKAVEHHYGDRYQRLQNNVWIHYLR